jgi:4-amino-4-deoxy-L-arabinose transferase-like glycosyltransferase
MIRGRSGRQQKRFYTYLAVLLLGLLFAQAVTSIPHLSVTFDEDLHISTGYSVLRSGDLRLVEDHPPLLGYWMSWPLLLSPDVPDPEEVPAWTLGDRRLFVRNEIWWNIPLDSWVTPPRIMTALLTLILGAFLFRWATDWFGPRAGVFALALLAFDPNILAHGALATLDLGVACLIFATMYGFQRVLYRPSTKNLVGTGVLLGLALSAKISAAILLPLTGGLLILWGLIHWRSKLPGRLLIYLGVALMTLWAVHLFDFGRPVGLDFSVPAPTYWRSFLRVGRHVTRGNRAYLMGETYEGGRWYYFPIAFALKTPLPALLLLGAAFLAVGRRLRAWRLRDRGELWREMYLASLPLGYFLVSVFNSINLGYRHLLPVVPFVYLFVARLAVPDADSWRPAHQASTDPEMLSAGLPEKSWPRRIFYRLRVQGRRAPGRTIWSALLVLLVLWQMVGSLRIWPFQLTFFNEIAGGPRNGYRYLADSNVDWGQASKALRTYLDNHEVSDPKLSSFTFFIRPELYGVLATPLPPLAAAPAVLPRRFNPAPGTYIISASTLRGLQLVDPEMYNWFWHREPDDIIANALLVYHVPQPEPKPTWLAQCLAPVAPLSPEVITEGFGRDDLRYGFFDCGQSWLIPSGGRTAGWYVLPGEAVQRKDAFLQTQLAQNQLSFQQTIQRALPPFTIYETSGRPVTPDHPVDTPIQVGGLSFLGHTLLNKQDSRELEVWTFWEIGELADRPASLMLHLLGPEGSPTVVGDGLGVPVDSWQEGDVIVQRHRLELPPGAPAGTYSMYTGAYWLDTLERWPVVKDGVVTGDQLSLPPVPLQP